MLNRSVNGIVLKISQNGLMLRETRGRSKVDAN